MSNHATSSSGQNLPADNQGLATVSMRLGLHYISCANVSAVQRDFHSILDKLQTVVTHKIVVVAGENGEESQCCCSLLQVDKCISRPFQQLVQSPLYGFLDLHIVFRFQEYLQDQNYEHQQMPDFEIDNIAAKVAGWTLLSLLSNLGLVSSQQSLDELKDYMSNPRK